MAKHLVDYSDVETLPEIWSWVAKRCPDVVAVNDPYAKPEVVLTYTQLNEKIQCFATGLQALGVAPGDRSTLIADNSSRWLIADPTPTAWRYGARLTVIKLTLRALKNGQKRNI